MGTPRTPAMLPLLLLAFVATTSALVPIARHTLVKSVSYHTHHRSNDGLFQPKQSFIAQTAQTALQMGYKSPDESNSYNDDAFGLVFLTGGIITQDVDFVGTFAALSAIAALGTKVGIFDKDERAPAVVALLTLLIFPVVSSLRLSGSLENVTHPLPVEIGLCLISAAWAFYNWSRAEENE